MKTGVMARGWKEEGGAVTEQTRLSASDMEPLSEIVDFVEGQITSLSSDIQNWCDENIVSDVAQPSPGLFHVDGYIRAPVPKSFSILSGQYAHSLRAVLDALACTLAKAQSGSDSDTYFPASKTEDVFKSDGQRKTKLLSDADRAIIAEFQPYLPGNEWLGDLHQADILNKHRRLATHAAVSEPAYGGKFCIIDSSNYYGGALTATPRRIADIQLSAGGFKVYRIIRFDEPDLPIGNTDLLRFLAQSLAGVRKVLNAFA